MDAEDAAAPLLYTDVAEDSHFFRRGRGPGACAPKSPAPLSAAGALQAARFFGCCLFGRGTGGSGAAHPLSLRELLA
jgi:hypothetical protein